MRLFEIEKGRKGGVEPDEQGDAEQIAGVESLLHSAPDATAQGGLTTGGGMGMAVTQQLQDADQGGAEQPGGDQQQVCITERSGQTGGEGGAGDGPQTAAGGNQSEQPLALGIAEQIRHEAPEYRDHEQIEHADPDEEDPGAPAAAVRQAKQQVEEQQIADEEQIDAGQQTLPWIAGADGAEQGHDRQHDQKGGGEQPLQVVHSAGDAHLVA